MTPRTELGMADVATIGLAGARLTRLVVTDTISQPVRVKIKTRWPGNTGIFKAMHRQPDGTYQWKHPSQVPTRPATFVGKLIECPWCTSVWVTAAAGLAYRFRLTRWGVRLIAAMHVAAMAVNWSEPPEPYDDESDDAPAVDKVAQGETKKVEPTPPPRQYTVETQFTAQPAEQVAQAVRDAERAIDIDRAGGAR